MRIVAFMALLTFLLSGMGTSAPDNVPADSTGRPADSLVPSTPEALQKQPPVVLEHSRLRILTGIPPDTATIAHDREPKLKYKARVEYPRMAREAKATGTVALKAYIDTTGTVRTVIIIKCTTRDMGFEDAAVQAAYQNKYRPATYKGKSVGIWFAYEVDFK